MARALPVDELVDERYEIRAALEQAAAFAAYRAFDREVEVEVALWHMRDQLFPDPARRHAFIGAVVAARGLRHPNLRRMFDAGDAGGVLYATCQLETDDGMLPRPGDGEALDDESLLHYATSVVDALDAAHQAGYVHGHLVPNDITHVAGLIKVGGVGLYGDVDPTASRSVWIADERFISPEVLSGQRATPASDVFSLAAMLAELASGDRDDDVNLTVTRVSTTRPELAEVLRMCLAITPDRRLSSAPELLEQVAMALGYEPTAAGAAELPERVDERPLTDAPLDIGTPDELPTRQLRALGKNRDWNEEELATVVEPPWQSESGAPPPPVPGMPPVGLPGPMPAKAEPLRPPTEPPRPANVRMVSRKPKSEPGQKRKPTRVPVVDRPELKPVVRPISEARGTTTGSSRSLGNYAPPRTPGAAAAASSRRNLWIALAAGAVAVAIAVVAIVLVFGRGGGKGDRATPADTGPVTDTPTPVVTTSRDAGTASPCPPHMVLVSDDDARYCIDRFEAPGEEGRMPSSGLSFTQAEATCRSRGDRLCTPDEWEAACRGERGASWPYGSTYRRGVCNVKESRDIAAAGSFPGCKSAAGVFDMSGNVAEWVQGKVVRGGSAADDSDGRCSRVVRRAGRSADAFSDVGYRCCADPRPR